MQPQISPPSFLRVLLSPIGSIGFLLVRPRLLAVALIPAALSLAILAAMLTIGVQGLVLPLGGWVEERWDLPRELALLAQTLAFFLLLVLSGIVSYLLVIPVSAPFCSFIVEEIEEELLATAPELIPPRERWYLGVLHSLREAFRRIGIIIPIYIGIFGLNLLPIIGTPLSAGLMFANNIMFLSLNAYSSILDRRKMTIPQKLRWMAWRKRLSVPLGLGLALLILIPCNVFWLPVLSAVAAARLYCEQALRERAMVHRQG